MQKIDYKKRLRALYSAPAVVPVIVEVPALSFLMIDGAGDPNSAPEFQEAVEALFSAAYTLKFMIKRGPLAVDYGVMPLEGVWWADDMSSFTGADKSAWKWTLMIMQPEQVTAELYERALAELSGKKKLPALSRMRLDSCREGLAAQILHVGPFSAEGPTIESLHGFIQDQGYRLRGRHREIYLSDLRRTAPERLKTIIRQPITPL